MTFIDISSIFSVINIKRTQFLEIYAHQASVYIISNRTQHTVYVSVTLCAVTNASHKHTKEIKNKVNQTQSIRKRKKYTFRSEAT